MIKRLLSAIGIILLLAVAIYGVRTFIVRQNKKELIPGTPSSSLTTKTTPTPSFDKKKYSLDDPTSLWVVVNKKRPLKPTTYVPADLSVPALPLRVPGNESMQLRAVPVVALQKLFAAAKTDGISLMVSSGYRSYSYQVNLYGGYVNSVGQAEADKTSARPGYSEHQTGLAVDIEPISQKCDVDVCFATTPEGIWLAVNAYKYGFIIRYTEDKVAVTGYSYEPWHIRYIGTDLSNEMHDKKIKTLEEFFDLGSAPDYSL